MVVEAYLLMFDFLKVAVVVVGHCLAYCYFLVVVVFDERVVGAAHFLEVLEEPSY